MKKIINERTKDGTKINLIELSNGMFFLRVDRLINQYEANILIKEFMENKHREMVDEYHKEEAEVGLL